MSINSASNITQKRWLWIILFLLVDFLACSANGDVKAEDHRESCSVQDHECHDDLSNVDKIMSWWDSMSSLKPLKCKDRFAGEPISDEDLDTVTMEFRILESCGKNDVQQLYAFKGFEEIREEGEEGGGLSGSGKMILKPRYTHTTYIK